MSERITDLTRECVEKCSQEIYEFMAGKIGRNSEKNLPRLRFENHVNHTELPRREIREPSGGKRVSNPLVRKSRY